MAHPSMTPRAASYQGHPSVSLKSHYSRFLRGGSPAEGKIGTYEVVVVCESVNKHSGSLWIVKPPHDFDPFLYGTVETLYSIVVSILPE